jgi:hypothetical protein
MGAAEMTGPLTLFREIGDGLTRDDVNALDTLSIGRPWKMSSLME